METEADVFQTQDEELLLALRFERELNGHLETQTERVEEPIQDTVVTEKLEETPKTNKPKRKRCGGCKKRIKGLISFNCRCGTELCTACRDPSDHECNFDWQELNSELLRKSLQKVSTDKLNRI